MKKSRRGISIGLLLVCVAMVMGFVGLVLEFALIHHVRRQMQGACDAAALAGAVELLDDDVLRPGTTPDPTDDVRAARRAAAGYGGANVVAGNQALVETAEQGRHADVQAYWMQDPSNLHSPLTDYRLARQANTLRVRTERSRRRGNALPLWIGPLLGIGQANVGCDSLATVDQRIYGFRPIGGGTVPVVPLTALHRGDSDSWWSQANAQARPHVNDRYTVDYRTGQVQPGPDGIPEVLLRSKLDHGHAQDAGNFGVLTLPSAAALGGSGWLSLFTRQLQDGLRSSDLVSQGGSISAVSGSAATVQGMDDLSHEWISPLLAARGLNRVWPLYGSKSSQGGSVQYQITGFGAGCLADVYTDQDGQLFLVVQPSLLATRTALVRAGEQLNPWIARLTLTR